MSGHLLIMFLDGCEVQGLSIDSFLDGVMLSHLCIIPQIYHNETGLIPHSKCAQLPAISMRVIVVDGCSQRKVDFRLEILDVTSDEHMDFNHSQPHEYPNDNVAYVCSPPVEPLLSLITS